jgi:hypothetical protein
MIKNLTKEQLVGKVFYGEVVDNNDPIKEGRCRIKIFGVYDTDEPQYNDKGKVTGTKKVEIPVDDIPWAIPGSMKTFAGGSDKGAGDISIPKMGSIVRITFAEGDLYSPEWHTLAYLSEAVKDDLADSYLDSHVILYDVDQELKVYYTPGNGFEIYLKKSHVTINPDASITIEHADSKSIIELVGGDINIVAESKVKVTTPVCVVDSPNIQLGENAEQSLIKGNLFKNFFDSHVHPSPGSPPAVPLPNAFLSKISKTL